MCCVFMITETEATSGLLLYSRVTLSKEVDVAHGFLVHHMVAWSEQPVDRNIRMQRFCQGRHETGSAGIW